jgi:NAD+ diphosphatase
MTEQMIRSELSASTGFSDNRLNRRADLRDNPQAVAALAKRPDALTVLLAGDVPVLLRPGAANISPGTAARDWQVARPTPQGELLGAWFDLATAAAIAPARDQIFLGEDEAGAPRFGTAIDKMLAETLKDDPRFQVIDLRSIAFQKLLPTSDLGPLGEAKAMLDWHSRHRFCAQCGGATAAGSSGWKRECPSCTAQHFPRTDPVVIMLVVRGDKCLLARQARFVAGSYSCIAGFVEPGETFENAVRRETWEEAGLRCGKVRYLACQPWPFPSSLMIGCIAESLDDTITLDKTELEDGRWFSREETVSMIERRHEGQLVTPPGLAIANTLMRAWAYDGALP